jgi:[ribosomal protein S5]-alanine N-acetyltransferase
MHQLIAPLLTLEPLTVAHADEMFAVLSDVQLYPYLDYTAPTSVEQLRKVYTRQQTRRSPDGREQWLNWVLRLTSSGALIGTVQATVLHDHSSWVAYVLSSQHWGRGYAATATQAMMDCLRDDYAVTRYLATVERDNERSIKLLQRLGFDAAAPALIAEHELSLTELLFVKALA